MSNLPNKAPTIPMNVALSFIEARLEGKLPPIEVLNGLQALRDLQVHIAQMKQLLIVALDVAIEYGPSDDARPWFLEE